jgi:hypothetical protein
LYLNISHNVHFCKFFQIGYRNSYRLVAFRPPGDLGFRLLDVSFNVLSALRDAYCLLQGLSQCLRSRAA